jgi:acyl dehydratase
MGRTFDEFRAGDSFVTPRRTITEADIVSFAGLTGDWNPVHSDEVFASASGFAGRIAHGPMMIGIAFGLAARLDLVDGTVIALLSVEWGFHAPVRPGDTVHAVFDVVETKPSSKPDRGVVVFGIKIVNQAGTVAQTGRAGLLLRRERPPHAIWGQAGEA